MFDREKARQIAVEAREWAEKKANEEFFAENLSGFCARGSAELYCRLRKAGFTPVLCKAKGSFSQHVFVMIGDTVIDITSTQFTAEYGKVTLVDKDKLPPYWWWRFETTYYNIIQMVEAIRDEKWPNHQIPRLTPRYKR